MNIIPAESGTTHLQLKGDEIHTTPILAWTYATGRLLFPLFAVPGRDDNPFSGIEHPDGTVSYPHEGKIFENRDEWHEHVESLPKDTKAKPAPEPVAQKAPAPKAAAIPDGDYDRSPIKFGGQRYKTKSFWSWPAAHAVFEIEPDEVIPSDKRVEKIKREEFFDLKRNGAAKIDPHFGIVDDPEPEDLAAANEAVEEDDEADLSDLI